MAETSIFPFTPFLFVIEKYLNYPFKTAQVLNKATYLNKSCLLLFYVESC